MLTEIVLILIGVLLIIAGGYLLQFAIDIDFFPLALLVMILTIGIIGAGIAIPFYPLIKSSNDNETLNMKACKNVGGSYEVIDKTWNGKFYTNIYGCIKK
jgi:hypothetical protein